MFGRIAAVGMVVAFLPGCGLPFGSLASTGFHFEVGRPASIAAPAMVHQSTGSYAATPVMAFAGGSSTAAHTLSVSDPCPPAGPVSSAGRGPAVLARGESCTLEDVCRALTRIESRLPPPSPVPEVLPRPLPRGAGSTD